MFLKRTGLHVYAISTQHCACNIKEVQGWFWNSLETLDFSFPDLEGSLKSYHQLDSLENVHTLSLPFLETYYFSRQTDRQAELWDSLCVLTFILSHSCCCPVTQLCLTLCGPVDCSTPGLPVLYHLPELTQIHVHWFGDAIQPSHPLSSPSPPALNLSQHQGLFQWVGSPHQMAKVLEFQLQHQSFQWVIRIVFLWDRLVCCPGDSQESSPTPQFKSIDSSVLSLLYGPMVTSIPDYWKNYSQSFDLCLTVPYRIYLFVTLAIHLKDFFQTSLQVYLTYSWMMTFLF